MKCPNCGSSNIYAVDTLDSEYYNGSYYNTVRGVCHECNHWWQWIEVFTFDHYEDLVEEEVKDHH